MKKRLVILLFLINSCFLYGAITDKKIISRFTNLQYKIYKVFKFHDDNVIYNYLSDIFTDKAMEKQYFYFLKQIRELAESKSVNIIKKILYKKIKILDKSKKKIVLFVSWEIYGTVRHQLHEHDRINKYEAIYILMYNEKKDIFKIDKTKILKSKRIDSGVKIF